MKIRKLIFSLLTIVAISGATTSVLSSCSGVDQDIIDNSVATGDKSVLAKWKDSDNNEQSVTLDQEIKTALTDQKSNQAFKSAVVDKVLWHWISNLSDDGMPGTNIKDRIKQWNKDIDKDYDNAVQSSKDKYYSNWKYYFQNQELNQYGGTKEDWKNHERYQKARQYFISGGVDTDNVGHIVNKSYFAVPKMNSNVGGTIYDGVILGGIDGIDDATGSYYNNLEAPVAASIGTSENYGLGSDALSASQNNILNPDWWPLINFYATARKDYHTPTDGGKNGDQDSSYAFIQGVAFDDYIKHVRPYSTSAVSWNYAGPTDLKNIYNNEKINDAGGDSSLLAKPSFAFPYFQEPSDITIGPNKQFQNFAEAFNESNNYFLSDRGSSFNLGLINFPKSILHMGTTALSLIDETTTGADATPYETYVAPIFSTLSSYADARDGTGLPAAMVTTTGDDGDLFPSKAKILSNFLFVDQAHDENPTTGTPLTDLKKIPSGYMAKALDLATIYEQGSGGGTGTPGSHDKLLIFNPNYHDTATPWYNEGARYLVNAIRLNSTNASGRSATLPYIMIRTTNGVSVEGIDGIDYLMSPTVIKPTVVDSKWVPGGKVSVERSAQIIKYRTAYENFANSKNVNGFSIIKDDTSGTSGALRTYMDAHMDDIILNAVTKVMTAPRGYYYDKGVLGLNFGTDKIPYGLSGGNSQWNAKLVDLFDAVDKLNVFQSTLSNLDAANKKIFAWSTTYQANSLINIVSGPSNEQGTETYTYYKNGLAQELPLVEKYTQFTSPLKSKTYFDATYYPALNTMADFSLIDNPATETIKTLQDLVSDVIAKYVEWEETLTSNDCYQKPLKDNKGTSQGTYGQYNENILTYNYYVNALLWTFGGGNPFSASIKTWALNKYVGTFFGGSTTDSGNSLGTYADAFTSLYLSGSLITDDNSLPQMFNTNTIGGSLTLDTYKSNLLNEQTASLNTLIGSNNIMDRSSINSFGYSDALIKFKQMQATLKWLATPVSGRCTYKNFITWLQNYVGIGSSSFQNTNADTNPSFIAWASKDNIKYHNEEFSDPTADVADVYGWKNNYNNIFNNIYTNTNLPDPNNDFGYKTYTSFKKYWQFAPMPGQTNDMMGYLGLLNLNSGSWGDVSSDVKSAITNFKDYCDKTNTDTKYTGTLYSLNNGAATPTEVRNGIVDKLKTGSPDPARITKYASFIDQQTGLLTANGIIDELNNAVGGQAKLEILEDAITDASILPDSCFSGYNNESAIKTYELKYGNSDPVIMDTDDQGNGIGSRITIMQISPADVANKKADDSDNNIMGRLADICGGTAPDTGQATGLVSYLMMQAALDTSNQTLTLNDVIKTQFNGGKVVVYDRRFNDQLGSDWVKDWKKKN